MGSRIHVGKTNVENDDGIHVNINSGFHFTINFDNSENSVPYEIKT